MMAGNTTREKTPLPVFVKSEHLPKDISVYEICSAAEKVAGPVTIDGAICISGLWRISPLYESSRIKILANGICVRGRNVQLENMNPFTMRSGDDTSGTKLFIGNLPFSYSSDAIKNHLRVAGVTLRSEVVWERARGPDGSLSDWKTGRRMVWINIPEKPLSKYLKMGNGFSASLYHKEMRQVAKCHKCLEVGHIAKFCEREVICLTCKKPGHKKGDPKCDLGITPQTTMEESGGESEKDNYESSNSEDDRTENSESESEDEDTLHSDMEESHTSIKEVGNNGDQTDEQSSPEEDVGPKVDGEVSEKNQENVTQNATEKEVSPEENGEVSDRKDETEKVQEKNASPKTDHNIPNSTQQNKVKVKSPKSSYKKKNLKGKKEEKKYEGKPHLKQAQITEFTPGGKRNSEDMVSPDNVVKGPLQKKLNLDNEQK